MLVLTSFSACSREKSISQAPITEAPKSDASITKVPTSTSSISEVPTPVASVTEHPKAEISKIKGPSSEASITNRNWVNPVGKDGDADGPAYVLYSKIGYNQATVNINLKDIESNLVRKSDGQEVCSYLFLGVDVFKNGEWINCADAGLCLVGNGEWHGFINRYQHSGEQWYSETTWWESSVNLNKEHEYQLLLKTSDQDEQMTLNLIDITDGNRLADSKTVTFKYTKKDGSNTRYYRDLAIDFPPEVCKDKQGNPTDDWIKVVEYNTNENLYVKNIHCYDAHLYNSKGKYLWTDFYEDYRFLWPDTTGKLSYECAKVGSIKRDYEDVLDMDMNTTKGN